MERLCATLCVCTKDGKTNLIKGDIKKLIPLNYICMKWEHLTEQTNKLMLQTLIWCKEWLMNEHCSDHTTRSEECRKLVETIPIPIFV